MELEYESNACRPPEGHGGVIIHIKDLATEQNLPGSGTVQSAQNVE
jgi:hypothetical protein